MGEPRLELKTSAAVPILLGLILVFPLCALVVALGGKITGSVLAALTVAAYVWLVVRMVQRRLVLDETGITAKGVFSTTQLDWNEADYYTFWSMDQNGAYGAAGAQGGLVGIIVVAAVAAAMRSSRKATNNRRFGTGRMKIVSRDRRNLVIDARYKKPGEALDRAFSELHARLRARDHRDFDPFVLSATELTHKSKGTLGLPDVDKIVVSGQRLSVKKRGKRLAWTAVSMKQITNGMLLLEELAERGLIVDAKGGMFVPPTVLDKLRAATARQAALPQARIVER